MSHAAPSSQSRHAVHQIAGAAILLRRIGGPGAGQGHDYRRSPSYVVVIRPFGEILPGPVAQVALENVAGDLLLEEVERRGYQDGSIFAQEMVQKRHTVVLRKVLDDVAHHNQIESCQVVHDIPDVCLDDAVIHPCVERRLVVEALDADNFRVPRIPLETALGEVQHLSNQETPLAETDAHVEHPSRGDMQHMVEHESHGEVIAVGHTPSLGRRRTPRILWMSAETPSVDGGGGERRQYHQIKALLEQGIEIEVASLRSPQSDASIGELVPVHRFGPRRRHDPRCPPELNDLLDRSRYDAAVVAHIESVPLSAKSLRRAGIPWLVDFQNVYSRWHADRGDSKATTLWQRREYRALRAASAASACSPEERDALVRLGAVARVIVAGNGVEPSEWPEQSLRARRPPVAAFFGSFNHHPNRHGLEWFTSQVWPRVLSSLPQSSMLVVGPGTPPATAIALEGVIHMGRVDDLATCLGGVRTVLVPIVEGMGSRVKFGEALASGAAVVSTTLGAEGFDAKGAFVRADEPGTFADATIELLADEISAARLGTAGRVLALGCFSWARTTAPIATWVRAVTA